jgi:transposase
VDKLRATLAACRSEDVAAEIRIEEIRDCLDEIERLNERIAELERRLRPFVERLAPALLDIYGASVVVAAGLLGHAGSMNNCRDAHAFAMRAGTAPIPCWSGNSSTVRLNRGGNRQLNRLLHNIAITQLRKSTHCGRLYYDRKRAEGKSHRAAIRSLKRQLATVVFYRLKPSDSDVHLNAAA